jgi:hypothetical protein
MSTFGTSTPSFEQVYREDDVHAASGEITQRRRSIFHRAVAPDRYCRDPDLTEMLRHEASVRDRDAKPKGPDAKSLPEPVRENDSVRLTSPRKTYQEFLDAAREGLGHRDADA